LAKRAIRCHSTSHFVPFFDSILSCKCSVSLSGAVLSENRRLARPGLSGFLLWRLFNLSAEISSKVALDKLYRSQYYSRQELKQGYALALSAWNDTKLFVQHAPPDAKDMEMICFMQVLLSFVLRGHEQALDLHELEISYLNLSAVNHRRLFSHTGNEGAASHLRLDLDPRRFR
jgi:hypothetical protein